MNDHPLRLMGGDDRSSGYVEMYVEGRYGRMEPYAAFEMRDATVMCREMGFAAASYTTVRTSTDNVTSVIYELYCDGHERYTEECGIEYCQRWSNWKCKGHHNAWINCTNDGYNFGLKYLKLAIVEHLFQMIIVKIFLTQVTLCFIFNLVDLIRIVGHNGSTSGRVELFHNGEWGSISACHSGWGRYEASAACKMLGYERGTASSFETGSGLIWLTSVRCQGTERNLLWCDHGEWGSNPHNCTHAHDVGISCFKKGVKMGDLMQGLRLVDGTLPGSGRVEVLFDGYWGTVCDYNWDNNDAMVVCRELGYKGGTAHFLSFPPGVGPIWLNGVSCRGTEQRLLDCYLEDGGWGGHHCGHQRDIGVFCSNEDPPSDIEDVRLRGGADSSSGRVEVLHDGIWGTVCFTTWGKEETKVLCHQIGYVSGSIMMQHPFTPPYMEWLRTIDCGGTEKALQECDKSDWGGHICLSDVKSELKVVCTQDKPGLTGDIEAVRLYGAGNKNRLEVRRHGHWGVPCNDDWSNSEALVACRQLGFTNGTYELQLSYNINRFKEERNVWPVIIRCKGEEQNLNDCNVTEIRAGSCEYAQDVEVMCL